MIGVVAAAQRIDLYSGPLIAQVGDLAVDKRVRDGRKAAQEVRDRSHQIATQELQDSAEHPGLLRAQSGRFPPSSGRSLSTV